MSSRASIGSAASERRIGEHGYIDDRGMTITDIGDSQLEVWDNYVLVCYVGSARADKTLRTPETSLAVSIPER
jgi:hypothetical protein